LTSVIQGRPWRVPRLFEELRVAQGDGRYMRLLKRIEKASILVRDDWGLSALGAEDRAGLFEMNLDRLVHHSHRIPLAMQGNSMHRQARSRPAIETRASAACGGRPACGSDRAQNVDRKAPQLDRS